MRVSVTLDDGLYRVLQDHALKRGMSFQSAINEVLARGLTDATPKLAGDPSVRRTARRPRKGQGRKPTRFDQLLEDL